jgi:hypothetical protein
MGVAGRWCWPDRLHNRNGVDGDGMTEEERFEQWFQQERRRTWEASRVHGDPEEPRAAWAMGLRCLYRDGWMARATSPQVATTHPEVKP